MSVFGFFPEDISRIKNSTITVKTWKFMFLFVSEVSPLRTNFRHMILFRSGHQADILSDHEKRSLTTHETSYSDRYIDY